MAQKKSSKEKTHLFGSTEKSDFILNMTTAGAQRMCGLYSIIAVTLLSIIAIPYYFTLNVKDYVDDMDVQHYLSESMIFYVSTFMIAAGLIGFLIYLVAHMKGQVRIKDNSQLLIVGLIILMTVWSVFASTDLTSSFFGYLDRSEGLLTILGYWGYFAVGMIVTADGWRKKLADFIVAVGALNGVVGILQSVPALYDVMPNTFKAMYVGGAVTDSASEFSDKGMTLVKTCAATGLAITPFALAAMMTVTFAFASAGFLYAQSKKRKILFGLSAVVMTAASLLTKVISGVIGIGSVLAVLIVIEIIRFVHNKDVIKPLAMLAGLCVVVGAGAAVMFASGAAKLNDEQIIFTDSFVRVEVGFPVRVDKESEKGIYTYLWDDGMYVAEQNLLTGVGPDNWQPMYNSGMSLDRSYNEYVDLAMTRGFPCLAFYGVFLVLTLVKMICALRKFIKGNEEISFVSAAVLMAAVGYMVQAFFNISSYTASPFFWLVFGLGWSYTAVKSHLLASEKN